MSWMSFDCDSKGNMIINGINIGRGKYTQEFTYALFLGDISSLKKLKTQNIEGKIKYGCTDGKVYKRIDTAFHHQKELDEKSIK